MPEKQRTYPLLFITALVMVAAGAGTAVSALILQPEKYLYKGLIFLAVALVNFGGGEVLNHPKKKATEDDGTPIADAPVSRKRNSCGLGNLLDIVGLVMFFIAASSFIYQR